MRNQRPKTKDQKQKTKKTMPQEGPDKFLIQVADHEKIIVALDVGTTKVCALIAAVKDTGVPEIIGLGSSPSHGLRKGIVVNIAKTVESVSSALKQAEEKSGVRPEHVVIGIAGDHVTSTNSSAKLTVRVGREVDEKLRDRVIARSLRAKVPKGHRIIHVIPREFILDGVDGVTDPIGMSAKVVEVKTHIVLGAMPSIANLVNCVQAAGVSVADIIRTHRFRRSRPDR